MDQKFAYRKVTPEELLAYASKLNEQIDREAMKACAKALYGDMVRTVHIGVEYEYNDEGGYDPRISTFHGYDARNEAMELDFNSIVKNVEVSEWSLKWYRENQDPDATAESYAAYKAREIIANDEIYEIINNFPVPAVEGEFDLEQPIDVVDLYVPIPLPE